MSLFEPLFDALNEAGVRYVVVVGLAIVLHGYARLTADVDLAVDLAPEEASRVIRVLVGMGLRPQVPVAPDEFTNPEVRERWFREKNMRAFSLVDPANPMRVVNLLIDQVVPFADLWGRSVEMSLHRTKVRVASLDDLIALKRRAGRPQDLVDIEELEQIRRRSGA